MWPLAGATLVGAFAWSQRIQIAEGLVDRELQRRGVVARYQVTGIGVASQRIENVVIGDPANPDLTARVADIGVAMGLAGPRIVSIRASGVRARGRLVDGRVRLGEIDKMLPPPSGAPFAFPDLRVTLADARLTLDTEAGRIGLSVDGRGNLSDGFAGRLAVDAPMIALAGCRGEGVVAVFGVAIDDGAPSLDGPARARAIDCGSGGRADSVTMQVDALIGAAFDRWQGVADFDLATIAVAPAAFGATRGRVTFAGDARATEGGIDLAARDLRIDAARAGAIRLDADYTLGDRIILDGALTGERARLLPAALASARTTAAGTAGTPIGSIATALLAAASDAGNAFGVAGRFALIAQDGRGALRLSTLEARSASGARLRLTGGTGVTVGWPGGGRRLDGRLDLAGGGFPEISADLAQPNGASPIAGVVRMAPFATADARIALTPVRFSRRADGRTRIDTQLSLDGPIADGRIDGLVLPVSATLFARGGAVLDAGCVPAQFRALRLGAVRLDPARLSLCPDGRASLIDARGIAPMRIVAPDLRGRVGSSPLALTAQFARIRPTARGFALTGVDAEIGDTRPIRIAVASLDGTIDGGAIAGTFEAAEARIAGVPLLADESTGDWRFADGALELVGGVRVSDAAADPRFVPLIAHDARFRLADNAIVASAALRAPATDALVTDVEIMHDLSAQTGGARLNVPGIAFGDVLQPDDLTRLTIGVIADVRARVSGSGRIDWSPAGITSGGNFATADAAFAAAFGPVSGLSTRVEFVDLLTLSSAPGQVATIAEVNPGIAIRNGLVRYELLPERRMRVEGGRWPLAGGTLTLKPTLLDFATGAERRMEFAVDGLDAGRFIARFELDDVAATGVFDGTLPMIFDRDGGRIADGSLVSRAGGGTLSYVGELSNADLGTWGRLAFDALRSIRYDALTIGLDGAIDGEMVTRVRFSGVNRATPHSRASRLLTQFIDLPFIFNIRVEAPFRGLLASVRGYGNPAELLRDRLPEALREERAAPPDDAVAVQPGDSGTPL